MLHQSATLECVTHDESNFNFMSNASPTGVAEIDNKDNYDHAGADDGARLNDTNNDNDTDGSIADAHHR